MKALAALAVMLPLAANAAEPGLCRAYATKLLNTHMSWMWNRAYSGCLMLEESDPQPPDNWEGAMRILDPSLTPIMPLDRDNVAAAFKGMPPPRPRPEPAASGLSDFPAGSDDWKKWCASHFPRTWDEATGTVIPYTSRKHERTPCPG